MTGLRKTHGRCFLLAAWLRILFSCTALLFIGSIAIAYDGLVEKRVFEIPSYTTTQGRTIERLKMGYETYGKLNAQGDNAVLICPFFGGTSHAAGKYRLDDPAPGYWDSIVGAGKPLDTEKYFIVSFDGLTNPKIKDGSTVSSGPASLNPSTGKPYGMRFPTVTVRDDVNVERMLVDHLGVKKIHAVLGASMGGMQAFEWAAAYPDRVARIVPVVSTPQCSGFMIGTLESWMAPIRMDPHWNRGDYYGKQAPMEGTKASMEIVLLQTRGSQWADKTFGRKWAAPRKDPAKRMQNLYASQAFLNEASSDLAAQYDANHLLYQMRTIQLFSVGNTASLRAGLRKIQAKVLLLPSKNDLLFPPSLSAKVRDILVKQGRTVKLSELDGPMGHLNGIVGISQAADTLERFLSN